MTSHPNRGWRSRWTVDTVRREARHGPTGLVVRFARAADDPAALDGEAVNDSEIAEALAERHGLHAAARMLARLLREAGDVYSERANS